MPAPPSLEILIATGNAGKAREIVAILSDFPAADHPNIIRWRTLRDLPDEIPEPHEDRESFAENAALKARYYARATGLWTLADDSGLEVDALGGGPGVRSARYADLPGDAPRDRRDAANNRKLIAALKDVSPEYRTARFRCALCLADADRILASAEGVIEGRIIDVARGSGGFGYDPHFFVPELGNTTAELTPEHKNRISHRGRALQKMQATLARLLDSSTN
ncbi:MAG: RdgB/HAM1 family non-canonical purine NTP pyrophosphatase [Phycisphaerae bacterium]